MGLIAHEDTAWLQLEYPGLQIRGSGKREIVEGLFEFSAAYDEKERQYIVNPNDAAQRNLVAIHDEYQIRITPPPNEDKLPIVQETGGRIRSFANEMGLPDIDLHIYPDNSLCLVGALDERSPANLRAFLDGPVLQFFYDQSYFERYGRRPRGEYSHGVLGIVENYFDGCETKGDEFMTGCLNILKKSQQWPSVRRLLLGNEIIKGHWPCLCGSGRRFKNCHPKVFQGLWQLGKAVRENPVAV